MNEQNTLKHYAQLAFERANNNLLDKMPLNHQERQKIGLPRVI